MINKGTLIVVLGPTAVGKTGISIKIAQKYNAEIISADSRQFYNEIPLGTAAPSEKELQTVKHHFVGNLSVADYFNVSMFEKEVLMLLEEKFKTKKTMLLIGGSGMYIDAVCKGIDDLPNADENLRSELNKLFKDEGITSIQQKLKELDPIYYNQVDLNNPKRIIRALEVTIQTGIPYSSQRTGKSIKRPFDIIKIGIELPREQLNKQIERRLDSMLSEGWLEEAKKVYPFRKQNALNTVGYKELFKYIEKEWSFEEAVEKIKVNTRRYAKRQMTWFKRDKEINWFSPEETNNICDFIDNKRLLF